MDNAVPDVTRRAAAQYEGAVIAGQRRATLAEIRQLPNEHLDAADAGHGPWVADRLERGQYHGWFAVNATREVAGGAGVWLMEGDQPATVSP